MNYLSNIKPEIIPGSHNVPDLGPAKLAPSTPFLDKKVTDLFKRQDVTLYEMEQAKTLFQNRLYGALKLFNPFFSDFDKSEQLPSTCALGLWKPTHFGIDEVGFMGQHNAYQYEPDVVDAVIWYYKQHLAKVDRSDVKISIPRGKNVGWPYPIGGKNRRVSDFLLGLSATLVTLFKDVRKTRLSDLFTFLESHHGWYYTLYGERYQHKGGDIPVVLRDGNFVSRNVESRVRAIYMDPKIAVMWLKFHINYLMKAILATRYHAQDREYISKFFKNCLSTGRVPLCPDFSKFDQRHGGLRGRQITWVISAILGHPEGLLDDMYFNQSLPLLIPFQGEFYYRSDGPILTSGRVDTTVTGNIGNLLALVQGMKIAFNQSPMTTVRDIMNPEANPNALVVGTGYGDDGALFFHPSLGSQEQIQEVFSNAYEQMDLSIEFEPTVKFLGTHYDKGTFSGSMDDGYPVGRWFQQQFFPERRKERPFSVIGLVGRLDLVDPSKAKEVFNTLKRSVFWDIYDLGPKFDFGDRHSVVRSLLPEVEKYANKISQVDDILQLYTHGLGEDGTDFIPDYLEGLIGQPTIDISDLDRMYRELDLDPALLRYLQQIKAGDLSSYQTMVAVISRQFNLQFNPGDVLA